MVRGPGTRGPSSGPAGAAQREGRRHARSVPSFARASQIPRVALCALCLCAALALGAAGAAPAPAAGVGANNAFSELATGGGSEAQTATTSKAAKTSTTETSSTSNSKSLILGALAAAVVLLSGIAFVIIRDARKVAPAPDLDAIEARAGHDASVRLAKRRAKAKAARQQRKRTRRA